MSSSKNGNGDRHHTPTPLQAVEQRLATRRLEEAADPISEPPITEDDPLTVWKRRAPGQPVTLEQVHAGLIATCEYSEAAIEGCVKIATDVREAIEVRTQQIDTLSSKVESNSAFIHSVDEEVAASNEVLDMIRRDVQFLKDDVRVLKESCAYIPAIKDMLGEILGRLPEPETKKAS